MNNPKSQRKKNPTKSKKSSQLQNNSNIHPSFSEHPIDLKSNLEPNLTRFSTYVSGNVNFSNPNTFTQFPPRPPQYPNISFSQDDFPATNCSSFQNFQLSQDESTFPISQHFTMSQGEAAFPGFDCSYRSNAPSDDSDDEEEVEEIDRANEGGNQLGNRFWSKVEEVTLVKAWLEVSQNKKTNTNQKGDVFWKKIEQMYDNVRVYKQKCFEEGTEGVTQEDLLKVRGLEQLRCRWRRINASCSKFCGSFASAESRRGSGESDEDVMKTAYKIYAADKTKTKLMSKTFHDQHAWGILSQHAAWNPGENIVGSCKKKTSTQGSDSKRMRINEDGNYASSTNPDTPTSGDIGCSGFPSSNESSKNKGKSKMVNMPSEAWQNWLDTVQNMNITRQTETEIELTRLKYQREKEVELFQVEREKTQLEREREARKQRKFNMELFKHLDSKPYLSEADQELRNSLVKKLFPSD